MGKISCEIGNISSERGNEVLAVEIHMFLVDYGRHSLPVLLESEPNSFYQEFHDNKKSGKSTLSRKMAWYPLACDSLR